jgi:hypothetical protein
MLTILNALSLAFAKSNIGSIQLAGVPMREFFNNVGCNIGGEQVSLVLIKGESQKRVIPEKHNRKVSSSSFI